jgi:L-tartrate/succinate antiporter
VTDEVAAATSKALRRAVFPLALGASIAMIPAPDGLTPNAWYFAALFAAVVAALVTEPIPGPVIGLLGVTTAALLRLVAPDPAGSIRWALTGFSDSTVWLMFVVLMFALGYQKTGLGHRIALTLVERLGGRTLGLGYAVAFADLALAPLTPSNTARSGGILFPIIRAIPALYGSLPGPTARRMGAYLIWTAFAAMCVTSSMFVTALAPNLLAQAMLKDIAGIDVTWTGWFVGFLPIGLVLFGLVPLLVYWIYPPTLTASTEVPKWARAERERLGSIKRSELVMALLVTVALALWILGAHWVNATTAALLVFCLMMLTGIIDWDDVLGARPAWNALVWFATLVTLAEGLNRVGFLRWFAAGTVGALGPLPLVAKIVAIVLAFFVAHYMFASLTAHTTALLPVFLAVVASSPELPVRALSLLLCYSLGLMGVLNPYATGSAPIYYASGYVTRREFWRLGAMFGALYLAILLGLGLPWLLARGGSNGPPKSPGAARDAPAQPGRPSIARPDPSAAYSAAGTWT